MRRVRNKVCGEALWWDRRVGEAVGMFVWIGDRECVQAPVLAMRSPRRGPHNGGASVKDVRDDFHTAAMIYLLKSRYKDVCWTRYVIIIERVSYSGLISQ
jgi:hypothetical protein